MNRKDESLVRYPRLEVALVEEFVREHEGQLTRAGLWERLSARMTRQAFDRVVGFLLDIGKMSVDRQGKLRWTLDPEPTGRGKTASSTRAAKKAQDQAQTRFSRREEANAITCFAFRNGLLEDLHAGRHSGLLENSELSRITDAEMKKLMIEASQKMAEILRLKEEEPAKYWQLITWFNETYCKKWEK